MIDGMKLEEAKQRLDAAGKRLLAVSGKFCQDCQKYNSSYPDNINCPTHRLADSRGFYHVACRKCDNIVLNETAEDSLCHQEVF